MLLSSRSCLWLGINLRLLLLLLLVLVVPSSFAFTVQNYDFRDSWSIITLGDLHMETDMTYHHQARQDCLQALQDYPILGRPVKAGAGGGGVDNSQPHPLTREYVKALQTCPAGDLSTEQLQLLLSLRKQQQQQNDSKDDSYNYNPYCQSHIVSLGDLGRGNKDSRHGDAGTTECFEKAKEYLDGFANIPYDLVTGNHDLEALDEFETDQENLQAWMDCFYYNNNNNNGGPQFHRYIGEKTLLLGLSTVHFREAPYSSHEVHIDDAQIAWFQQMVESHSADDGWKILVFSHAPIMGSGLRVLQNVHVTSGCAWLNHCSSPETREVFIQIVQQNPQIKCWSSGHFHLSHESTDSLVQVGSCTFIQVGVMGPKSTRDGRRQTRFLRGCGDECIEIYSINHHVRVPNNNENNNNDDSTTTTTTTTKAQVRLDATIDLKTGKLIYAHDHQPNQDGLIESPEFSSPKQKWFQAYVPQEEDGCYLEDLDGPLDATASGKVCWWHMADGKVLGLHQGQLVEYDAKTLAPLGVVVTEEQLQNREVMVVQNKTTLVLVNDDTHEIEVVHPNADDGSYWRRVSRSKVIRLEEQAREEVAKRWIEEKQQQRSRKINQDAAVL